MKIAESSGAQSLQSSYPWGLMNINEPRRGRALWLSCAGIFHSLENLHADDLIGSRGAVESQISKRRCSPICKWRAQRVLILVLVNCMLSRGRRDGGKKNVATFGTFGGLRNCQRERDGIKFSLEFSLTGGYTRKESSQLTVGWQVLSRGCLLG